LIKTGAPKKRIGLIKTVSRIYPKKASTRRVHRKKSKKSPIPREINEFSFQGILQPTTPTGAADLEQVWFAFLPHR